MTKVDKYLTKYLDGSITELEVKEFRELIESEPHLQTELRQILDLRSLVHDDMLALNPPEYLSRNIRAEVGERFATLAQEEEEERRRPLFFTERIAGSFITAMVVVVMAIIAPALIAPSGGNNQGTSSDLAALQNQFSVPATQQRGIESIKLNGAEQNSQGNNSQSTNGNAIKTRNSIQQQENRGSLQRQETLPNTQLNSTLASTNEESIKEIALPVSNAIADNNVDQGIAKAPSREFQDEQDKMSPLTSASSHIGLGTMLMSMTYNDENELENIRTISSSMRREVRMTDNKEEGSQSTTTDYIASNLPAVSKVDMQNSADRSDPRIAFGFTVGAGSLTRSSSVAVTQGAGYAAFNFSKDNRIGIEAGGSKFRYVHTTYSQDPNPTEFGKRNGAPGTEWNSVSNNTNGSWEVYRINGYGSGNGTGNNGGSILPDQVPGNNNDPTQVKLDGNTNSIGSSLYGGTVGVQQPGSANTTINSHSYESDTSMGYGMFFYDRRVIELGESLNIHSRIGLGGTDGGLIVDLRAYAAFATHENVAITVGIGGSALREFSKDASFNANYGVQVGAELGF